MSFYFHAFFANHSMKILFYSCTLLLFFSCKQSRSSNSTMVYGDPKQLLPVEQRKAKGTTYVPGHLLSAKAGESTRIYF